MTPKLIEIAPNLAREMMLGLASGRTNLADQVKNAVVDRWTYDSSSGADAIYIYLIPHRELNAVEQNIVGLQHLASIPIGAREGTMVVDIDNFARVMGIEVLFRKDVVEVLKRMNVANNGT